LPEDGALHQKDGGMATTLIRRDDADTQEEERLRARIDSLREEIASTTALLEDLRVSLLAFEARFDAHIGVLIIELDRLSVQIAEYERRIAALSEPVETWSRVEEQIRQEFRAEWERIEAEGEEARQSTQRVADLPAEPPQDVKEALRKLYRKLARDYHPDLAKTDEERAFHEDAMRRINAAYESNDLDALQRLEAELPTKDEAFPGATSSARIAWAAAQIGRLEQTLSGLGADITRLMATDKYRLYEKAQADPSVLDRLEADYLREIGANRDRLEAMIAEYQAAAGDQFMNSETTRD
jgi:DNA repair exonuclease SbcCD ATPase subunit